MVSNAHTGQIHTHDGLVGKMPTYQFAKDAAHCCIKHGPMPYALNPNCSKEAQSGSPSYFGIAVDIDTNTLPGKCHIAIF